MEDEFLPPRPTRPLPTDCCGTGEAHACIKNIASSTLVLLLLLLLIVCVLGCTPCVNDLYEEELSEWLKLCSMTAPERHKWYSDREAGLKMPTEFPIALSREKFQQLSIHLLHYSSLLNYSSSLISLFRMAAVNECVYSLSLSMCITSRYM